MLETIKDLFDKNKILAGNFNFLLDAFLDSYGGKTNSEKDI